MPLRDAALLLLGHGSTLNADSSTPTYEHAEEIRRRRLFAEVHVAFWKEEPNFRQALRQTSCQTVYVVPNFISSGYFTEQIIPRELGLTGSSTHLDGRQVYYCAPVGLSGEAMTTVLLKRAREVVAASPETCDPAQACLFICGHGTSLNDNSTKIIHEQVEIIRSRGLYADCQGVLMEQSPFVKDWRTLTACPDVIVVPFFISDGLHSYEDIPVLLGLTHNMKEKGFTNPHQEKGRRLWYATAIGTDPAIADVIINQVEQSEGHLLEEFSTLEPVETYARSERDFRNCVPKAMAWTLGEVLIRYIGGAFEVRHKKDDAALDLRPLRSLSEWREMILRDAHGDFRPLRAAPNLQRGWIMVTPDGWELMNYLDYLYPAAMPNASMWREQELPVTPWAETAERQTGRFRVVREINDAAARELVAEVCQKQCLKQRLWSPAAQEITTGINEIPLLCPEACNYFVGKAREKLKGPGEE